MTLNNTDNDDDDDDYVDSVVFFEQHAEFNDDDYTGWIHTSFLTSLFFDADKKR